MLYYYAKKSRICLVGHFTIIFYYGCFVKQNPKYLAISPRFASRDAAFLVILCAEHLFSRIIQKPEDKICIKSLNKAQSRYRCMESAVPAADDLKASGGVRKDQSFHSYNSEFERRNTPNQSHKKRQHHFSPRNGGRKPKGKGERERSKFSFSPWVVPLAFARPAKIIIGQAIKRV